MNLEIQEITLSSGQKAQYEYDHDSDLLEIFFCQDEAAAAIELTESIVLRFDWETSTPLSLSLISASCLVQPTEFGEKHFQLLTDEWPDEVRDQVWAMLRKPPLSDFLKISSYASAHTHRFIPITSIVPPARILQIA